MPKSKIKCNKRQSRLNMQAASLVFSKPPKILTAGGTKACTKPNLKILNTSVFMKKVIPRGVRLSQMWSTPQ